jgi:hypothetical protein
MEEELTKHTKKIYHTMKTPGHSFWEKGKEVAVEIFIIVFAVTLSIWLHSWSDHRHEQKETAEFLRGLKDDLSKDIRLLEENKDTIARIDSSFRFLGAFIHAGSIDTASEGLISHYLNFSLVLTHPQIGRYEGFKSSGKIGTIENDSLKQNILAYYQQTLPDLGEMEALVNSFQSKILDVEVDRNDAVSLRTTAKTIKMRALLQFATSNMDGVIQAYEEAQQQAKKIIALIDAQ